MNSLVSNLKEMLKLEERREQLVSELDKLTGQLNKLKNSLDLKTTEESTSDSTPAAPRQKAGRKPKAAVRAGRAPRGETKQRILAELENAGAEGASVKDLADSLGMRNTAIHAWFNTTGKKVSEIKKVGTARYALSGTSSAKKEAPEKAAPAKATRQKAPKKAKAAKAPKTPKAPKSGKRTRKGTVRGELKNAIVSTLEKAGSKGMTVREISEKTGAPYKNVYIWFVTTGKKNSSIKRIAPATYRLDS